MKKMLFVNGSYNEIPLIKAAHNLGYYVITSGNDPSGEGHKYANEYIPCDYSNKEAIYDIARTEKVDAICSCGNDFGAISAAYASEKLGLPGHDSYENSRVFHEKDCFKKLVKELDILSPKSYSFTNEEEAMRYIKSAEFPQIIKPVDLGGGKGISVINKLDEAEIAIKNAFKASKIKHIVIEDYISGKQQGITVFIKDKKVVFEYSTDDYSLLNPFMVWVAYGSPAYCYSEYREMLLYEIEKLAKYKNIADGFLTIQYILKDGKPYLLETMRRCLGNCHYKCMTKDTGVDFYEWFIASEAGLDCSKYIESVRFKNQKSGFLGIYGDKAGKIKSISINEKLQTLLFDSVMLHGPGYELKDYLGDKLGMMFYTLKDSDEEWFNNNMRDMFKVEME